VDFNLEKFQVAAEEFNKLELWEWLEPVKITVELNIHHHEHLHVNMIPTT
jgi:hypothetical protein